MPDIAVVDYGMGNLRSVAKALVHVAPGRAIDGHGRCGGHPSLAARGTSRPERDAGLHARAQCERICAMSCSRRLATKPFLGICLGLQMLFDDSEEGPTRVPGRAARRVRAFPRGAMFDAEGGRLKVPHMGWNPVQQRRAHPLWHGIADDTRFYFAHSYYPVPALIRTLTVATAAIRRRLPARLRGLISSPCSSIPRKVISPDSSCSPTSFPGTDAPQTLDADRRAR